MVASKADIMLTRAPVVSVAAVHVEVGCPSLYVGVIENSASGSSVDIDMVAPQGAEIVFRKVTEKIREETSI